MSIKYEFQKKFVSSVHNPSQRKIIVSLCEPASQGRGRLWSFDYVPEDEPVVRFSFHVLRGYLWWEKDYWIGFVDVPLFGQKVTASLIDSKTIEINIEEKPQPQEPQWIRGTVD